MKLSKVVTGTAVVALSTLVLSACSSSSSSKNSSSSKASSSKVVKKSSTQKQVAGGPLKDGTYKLNETGYDHGYKVEMAMTVKDGKITSTKYDYVDKNGKSKTKDASYEKAMKAKVKVGPKEYIPELNKSLVAKQSPAKVDVVSGATHSSDTFILYADQLVNAAQNGNTNKIEVDNIVYK